MPPVHLCLRDVKWWVQASKELLMVTPYHVTQLLVESPASAYQIGGEYGGRREGGGRGGGVLKIREVEVWFHSQLVNSPRHLFLE